MIKKLIVKGLNQKHNFDLDFNSDLNLFTGKNGCGKTTLLKLIWYLTSNNIYQAFKEIAFDYIYFKSDSVDAKLTITIKGGHKIINGHFKQDGLTKTYKDGSLFDFEKDLFPFRSKETENSIFFPTFRRIEGGFSIDENRDEFIIHEGSRIRLGRNDDLNSAFNDLSRRISPNNNHKFIASISTTDIIKLLNEKYTDILEKISTIENDQSKLILRKIRLHEQKVLGEIEILVKETDSKKEDLLKPFTVLSHLIQEIFLDKSIQITRNLTLGEASNAIISDKLSAGEKQMLSFLCYNSFSDNTAIFIDEPELSLHTDWQRILFPTLLEQSTNNQFFVATHSPFIYSKYSDKEFILDIDKGGYL